MNRLNITFCQCHSFKKHNSEQHLKFIWQSTLRPIRFQESDCHETVGHFFVKHFPFIINSRHIYVFSVSVLDYKGLISPEFQRFFRYMLLRKPLIHLRNVCLEVSGCCVLINIHFDQVNEAAVQVCQWLNWIIPCTGDP